MAITRALARGDTKHANTTSGDVGRNIDFSGLVLQIVNEAGNLVDPPRILTHPGFNAVEGDGILTYRHPTTLETVNPDTTTNFILAPAPGMETTLQKTLKGSILVQQAQDLEDVVITETWVGGSKLSVLSSMFRTLYKFWTTVPGAGKFLVWQPQDLTVESFGVFIVDVRLGTANNIQYREYRSDLNSSAGSYQLQTLVVRYKIVREAIAPKGSIRLEGV